MFCLRFYQITVNTVINNAIVVNIKTSKMYKFFVLQIAFFSLKLVGTVFVTSLFNLAMSFDLVSSFD